MLGYDSLGSSSLHWRVSSQVGVILSSVLYMAYMSTWDPTEGKMFRAHPPEVQSGSAFARAIVADRPRARHDAPKVVGGAM
jgi:hypothetical protein